VTIERAVYVAAHRAARGRGRVGATPDEMQDAWVVALDKIRRFDPNKCGTLETAVYTNVLLRGRGTSAHGKKRVNTVPMFDDYDPADSVDVAAEVVDNLRAREILAHVAPSWRPIVEAHFVDGLPWSEAAQLGGKTELAARSYWHKTRPRLQQGVQCPTE